MARRCIFKGDLDKTGLRKIMESTMDADKRWRDDVKERVPDDQADERIRYWLSHGYEPWPPPRNG